MSIHQTPDDKIPILDEPPIVTKARTLPGGPYYVMPDSGRQVSTDFYANIDLDTVQRVTEQFNDEAEKDEAGVTADGKAIIPDDIQKFVNDGSSAGAKLLEIMERRDNAGSPELERGSQERLRRGESFVPRERGG